MTVAIDSPIRTLFDGPHSAILSTSSADGRPQSSVIFADYDGDTVVFSTIKGRLKTRNMNRNPWVSLLILSATGRYADIRGRVEITEDPDKVLLQQMYDRYMGGKTPPPEPEAERVIVRITPEHIYTFPPA